MPVCPARNRVTSEGACVECEPYTIVVGNTRCERPTCYERQYISIKGECTVCEEYTKLDRDNN